MYKLAIFDLDGTLLDTIGDLAASCNFALQRCGFKTHDTNEYKKFVGNGIMKLIERALPEEERNDKTMREMREYFMWHYSKNNDIFTKPYDGIIELLHKLQNSGCKLAVASNKYQAATECIVKSYFKEFDFVSIYGQREGIPIKPNPYVINQIIKESNVEPCETLYIGDSLVDAKTASAVSEVKFICVTWGFTPRKDLESFGDLNLTDNTSQIWEIYKQGVKPYK